MSVLNIAQQKEDAPAMMRSPLRILAGIVLALGVTFVGIALFSAILFFGSVNEKWVVPVMTVLSLLALFFGAKFAAKPMQEHGFVLGAAVGVLYYVLLCIIALLMLSDFTFSVRTAVFMLIGVLTGGVGGLAGQTTPEKRSKHKKKKK